MPAEYFAIRIEAFRVVAARVEYQTAAALLDAGQPILLGTSEDLYRLASRLGRPLWTIARGPTTAHVRSPAAPVIFFHAPPANGTVSRKPQQRAATVQVA